jgi:hypothetical protein
MSKFKYKENYGNKNSKLKEGKIARFSNDTVDQLKVENTVM